jgi:hypothetical protein
MHSVLNCRRTLQWTFNTYNETLILTLNTTGGGLDCTKTGHGTTIELAFDLRHIPYIDDLLQSCNITRSKICLIYDAAYFSPAAVVLLLVSFFSAGTLDAAHRNGKRHYKNLSWMFKRSGANSVLGIALC